MADCDYYELINILRERYPESSDSEIADWAFSMLNGHQESKAPLALQKKTAREVLNACFDGDWLKILDLQDYVDERTVAAIREILAADYDTKSLAETYKTSDPRGVLFILYSAIRKGGSP